MDYTCNIHRTLYTHFIAFFFVKKHVWIVFRLVVACHTTTPSVL